MLALELGLDAGRERFDQRLGENGIGGAGLLGRQRAGDDADANEEALLAADDARPVERILIVGGLRERAVDDLLELGRRRHGAEEAWIEHGIEQARPPPENGGKPRRGPHDVGDQTGEARIGGKQREELNAGRHVGDHPVEGRKRQVGFGGPAEGVEQ